MLAETINEAVHFGACQVVLAESLQTPVGALQGDLLLVLPRAEVVLQVLLEGGSELKKLPFLDVLLDALVYSLGVAREGVLAHDGLHLLVHFYISKY